MKIWRYEDILRFARRLVDSTTLTSRAGLKIVDKEERFDETYWSEGLDVDISQLKIVSPRLAVWAPLYKQMKARNPSYYIKFANPQCPADVLQTNIMSYCKEYDDHADIVVHNKSNRICVQRFLETKEMLHLLTDTVSDEESQRQLLTDVLLENSLDGRTFVSDFTKPLKPEAVGFYLAIEVLVPWCLRNKLNEMIDAKATNFQIAKAFMVPEFVIRHMRNVVFADNSYLGVSYEWNNRIQC